jgi:hypothetical protein
MSRNCLRFHRHLPAAQPKWIRGEFYLRPSIADDRTGIESKATVEMLIGENFIRGSLATFDRIGDVQRKQKLDGGETSTVAGVKWNRASPRRKWKVENKQKCRDILSENQLRRQTSSNSSRVAQIKQQNAIKTFKLLVKATWRWKLLSSPDYSWLARITPGKCVNWIALWLRRRRHEPNKSNRNLATQFSNSQSLICITLSSAPSIPARAGVGYVVINCESVKVSPGASMTTAARLLNEESLPLNGKRIGPRSTTKCKSESSEVQIH